MEPDSHHVKDRRKPSACEEVHPACCDPDVRNRKVARPFCVDEPELLKVPEIGGKLIDRAIDVQPTRVHALRIGAFQRLKDLLLDLLI